MINFFNQSRPAQNYQSKLGFTLVELILYVALISIIVSAAVLFTWDIIYGRVKSQVQLEVNQNLRLATQRISYEIRNSSGINSISGSSLSLKNLDQDANPTDRDPTVIDLNNNRLRIGQGYAGDCPVSDPCDLTSNLVKVTSLNFTDQTQGDSTHVQFEITIEYDNLSGRSEWDKSQSYAGSVEIRAD